METLESKGIENKTLEGAQNRTETAETPSASTTTTGNQSKIKTRSGSGYLKQLYSTAKVTAGSTQSNFKSLTTFLVNLIPTDKVDASELQVRTHFGDEDLTALSNSIKEHGVLQPILVIQKGDRYEVIAGERRLRAAKLAGLDRIPARIFQTNDKATHEIALRENLDRVDLHPIEEGEGYLMLLESGHYTSHEAIAKAFGKPKSRITECIGYTRLPEESKALLLKHGIKTRAFLRQLFDIEPEKHFEKIEAQAAIEKKDYTPGVMTSTKAGQQNGEQNQSTALRPKALEKAFQFSVDSKRVQVSAFKWKASEGREKILKYIEQLEKLSSELKKQFT